MSDLDAIREDLAHNISEFMEKGPGLRLSTRHFSLAYDPDRNEVLRGGLGAMGVGQMWGPADSIDPDELATLPKVTRVAYNKETGEQVPPGLLSYMQGGIEVTWGHTLEDHVRYRINVSAGYGL